MHFYRPSPGLTRASTPGVFLSLAMFRILPILPPDVHFILAVHMFVLFAGQLVPQLREILPGHWTACHLAEELDLQGVIE